MGKVGISKILGIKLPSHFCVDFRVNFFHSFDHEFVLSLTAAIINVPLGPFSRSSRDLFPLEFRIV